MEEEQLSYKREAFSTHLYRDRLYTSGHCWLCQHDDGLWHVGLTRFGMRVLGDMVEFDLEVELDAPVKAGEVIGWIEGLKAVTDLCSPMDGRFKGPNPALAEAIELIQSDPHEQGWIFALEGTPGDDCVDADGYAMLLNTAIDRMTGKIL